MFYLIPNIWSYNNRNLVIKDLKSTLIQFGRDYEAVNWETEKNAVKECRVKDLSKMINYTVKNSSVKE